MTFTQMLVYLYGQVGYLLSIIFCAVGLHCDDGSIVYEAPKPPAPAFNPREALPEAMRRAEIAYFGYEVGERLPKLWECPEDCKYKAWYQEDSNTIGYRKNGIKMGSLVHECVHYLQDLYEGCVNHRPKSRYGQNLCETAPGWSLYDSCGGEYHDQWQCN